MHLTKDQLYHIDKYRINYLAYFINIDKFKEWFQKVKIVYPNISSQNAIYTACSLTTCLVIYYLTGQNVLNILPSKISKFKIGYCYEISYSGCYDHCIVVIPGINEHQIIHSHLNKHQITAINYKFNTIKELTKILLKLEYLKILFNLWPVIICKKIKILNYPKFGNIIINNEKIQIFKKILNDE